jgi:hypothetical protein
MGQSDVIKIGWRGFYCLIWRPISCEKYLLLAAHNVLTTQLPDIHHINKWKPELPVLPHTEVPFYHLELSLYF